MISVTHETKAGGLQVQGLLVLQSKLEASLDSFKLKTKQRAGVMAQWWSACQIGGALDSTSNTKNRKKRIFNFLSSLNTGSWQTVERWSITGSSSYMGTG